jgi:hypothetical protein
LPFDHGELYGIMRHGEVAVQGAQFRANMILFLGSCQVSGSDKLKGSKDLT